MEPLAVLTDDQLRTTGHYLLTGAPIFLGALAVLLVGGLFGVRFAFRRARHEAQLMTHSSAFWARWPPDRLSRAPYAELAAEAARCGQLVICAQNSLRDAYKRRKVAFTGDHFERRLAEYQGMLAAVQQAMARYPQQAAWPNA